MVSIPCLCIVTPFVLALVIQSPDVFASFQLTILHTNDVHSRFEQYTLHDGRCPRDFDGNCFGGLARRSTMIKRTRNESENVILLDAGDQYQGTPWFFYYKGKAACHFMNHLRYDAMSLGNHEFDNDIEGLIPFLTNVTFPVVCANINSDKVPELNGLIDRSTVLRFGRQRIGVVGYLTKETPALAKTGKLIFEDEVKSVQKEVDRLTEDGVNIIIGLGHAGFVVDKDIATKVKGMDIVIGGHTNTFLYTGSPPSTEIPEGPYPLVVTQENGEKVLVLEAFAFGKYLGYLQATFNDDGKVVKWNGNPILLDKSVEQDSEIEEELSSWSEGVQTSYSSVVGSTSVHLDGKFESCRLQECVLGNLITDAMVDHYHGNGSGKWTKLRIAVMNGGGIRSSIAKGNITYGDVLQAMPFGNGIDIVELLGNDLIKVLEFSVADYSLTKRSGRFLQVSGLIVTYDLRKESLVRVQKVMVVCEKCKDRHFDRIDVNTVYQVALPSYLVSGGDGFSVISKLYKQHYNLDDIDSNIVVDYLKNHSPVHPELENRIILITNETSQHPSNPRPKTSGSGARHCVQLTLTTGFFLYAPQIGLYKLFSQR